MFICVNKKYSLRYVLFLIFCSLCCVINPFPPSVPIWHRLAKLSILILEGIIKKISYERRDYESVDEKSLF